MTDVLIAGQVGEQNATGIGNRFAQGERGEQLVSELHGRLYQQNYRGKMFSGGMGFTSISASTYTTANLTATCTPVVGVWNPSTSLVNLVILQATLAVGVTALQATGCGPFVWCSSVGNTAISTGAAPLNRKTLTLTGSAAKDLTNTVPTGLTNNLVVRHASSLGGGSAVQAAFLATQVALQTQQISYTENIDGSIIVPPGGFLALLATATGVAHSAASSILWEEVLL